MVTRKGDTAYEKYRASTCHSKEPPPGTHQEPTHPVQGPAEPPFPLGLWITLRAGKVTWATHVHSDRCRVRAQSAQKINATLFI